MRWTRQRQAQFFARTNDAATYGEVVWFWRSNAGAKVVKTLSRLTGDGGNQAMVTGKSTKETVKTIAQGRPDDPPVPVVLPRAFCCTRTMGAVGTRPSLRPLLISRAVRFNNSDISCRENADSHPLGRHAPLQAGHPVRRELSVKHERLWDTRPVIPDRIGDRRRA